MPLKSKSQFDSLVAMTALLNNRELEALAFKCEELLKDRERIKREELRQELMGNLQRAIGDILHHGFHLVIENTDDPEWIANFNPNECFHIEIK